MEQLIYQAMANVMKEVEGISKDRNNASQGYKFRGIDDVYNELHSIFANQGIFTTSDILDERTEEKTTKSGSALIYRILKIKYRFYTVDGSYVETVTIGEGMDSGDKASNKAMAVAHKYALMQAFSIPTEDAKDPENDSHEVAPNKQTQKPTESHSVKPIATQPVKQELSQTEIDCKLLCDDLGLTPEEKSTLWLGCNKNSSNMLIALKAQKTELKNAFRTVLTNQILNGNENQKEAKTFLGMIDMMSCKDIAKELESWTSLVMGLESSNLV